MIGGVLGSVFSLVVSVLINIIYMFSQNDGGETEPLLQYITSSPERISVIPVWLFLLGMIFSMLIGLVSGAYPAMKAVKISPLEAMKNE
jgi:ABC-type antimicrobial peptide transport system permease subunit